MRVLGHGLSVWGLGPQIRALLLLFNDWKKKVDDIVDSYPRSGYVLYRLLDTLSTPGQLKSFSHSSVAAASTSSCISSNGCFHANCIALMHGSYRSIYIEATNGGVFESLSLPPWANNHRRGKSDMDIYAGRILKTTISVSFETSSVKLQGEKCLFIWIRWRI